ncbi:hypothetical protein DSM106972_040790 [Dulcicalothrix desertica PCC 7102]|uniref:Transferase hexapeptide repeat containing protein n=1 Tax=Dulcicalothrix desertica PCC 7102 TaxID=232991 RepID=A0A3S1B5L9_9CYAN|nr:transferase hexapeptide repeat containing protein [Dulcicalothrix desertica]RUT05258.1 hypothetical protein DSM106972_040790 [Dulcicalothrix desertica PCC 7102]TWH43240.1 hypothetical protein CAL7102_06946 [Dulcicalothrix desertica PCC 7102]
MLDEAAIEQRLATLEREVAALKQKNNNDSTSDNWLNKLIGSISDEAAFLEALEYGRSFRQSDKPEETS